MTTYIVENSAAPSAIGDTVAAFPALHAKAWESEISVYLGSKPCRELLLHPKITQLEERPRDGIVLDIQKLYPQYSQTGLSMTRAYLEAIGLGLLARQQRNPEVILGVGLNEEPQEKYDFLIAPFSASDNGTNTKLWPVEHWKFILGTLHDHKQRVGILGAVSDDTPALGEGGSAVLGQPLSEVCRAVRTAKATITCDNGIGWLCQGMRANHIVLLPRTHHPNWSGNPASNAVNLFVDHQPKDVLGALGYLAKI